VRLRQLGEHEPHVVHEGDTIRRHVIDERDPVFVGHVTAFIATTKPWSGCHPRRFSGSADPPLPEVTIPPVHTRVNPLSPPANNGSYHTIGCRKLDLFGREVVAVDGTPMKAVNSTDRSFILEKLKSLTNRLPTIQGEQRQQILERFAAMYKPAIGTGPVMDYMAGTGVDSLKGEDILKVAPQKYSSTSSVRTSRPRVSSRASRRSIWPMWAVASSIAITARLIRMPAKTGARRFVGRGDRGDRCLHEGPARAQPR
jgi:hypothetical protein